MALLTNFLCYLSRLLMVVIIMLVDSYGVAIAGNDKESFTSPESAITCGVSGDYTVVGYNLSDNVDDTNCMPWSNACAPCIKSLEEQNCKLLNVATTESSMEGQFIAVTYFFSCSAP